ncbi:MAG: rhomboid family intramembrane serine protease [Chloroflexi bacterium SZAS-1]|nr:rhomboid family intramembrane serine protease [Chloroflexi bacterium SZAS-1]
MTEPEQNKNDLHPALGPQRNDEPPVYGEAQPVVPQPQPYALRLPLRPARAVWVLLALNIGIFIIPTVLQLVGVSVGGYPINDLILALGQKENQTISDGQYYRFLTSMFLHSGLLHIGFNAWALYVLGPESERIYGTPRFLILYFLAGLAGGVASYLRSPYPAVGASGAIFGLIGGLAIFYYVSRKLLGEISRQQLGSLITVIMINLFIGFSTPRIDNYAHIGGLIGGALVGWLLAPRFEVDERLYPPQIVRRSLLWGWVGVLGILAVLVALVATIQPPL